MFILNTLGRNLIHYHYHHHHHRNDGGGGKKAKTKITKPLIIKMPGARGKIIVYITHFLVVERSYSDIN